MNWFLIALVILALIAAAFLRHKARGGASDSALPYSKAPALFTPAERSFFGVLTQAVGGDFQLFGKVRVADVLIVTSGLDRSARHTAFNRISAKHFDFVLCSPGDFSVLCVIELNDKSHSQTKRQQRDDFLEAACRAAGLPLLVFPAQATYSLEEVRRRVAEVVSGEATQPVALAPVVSIAQVEIPTAAQALATEADERLEAPACPKCSSAMLRRTAKGGENAGREFWGCPKFPSCRGMLPL